MNDAVNSEMIEMIVLFLTAGAGSFLNDSLCLRNDCKWKKTQKKIDWAVTFLLGESVLYLKKED